MYKRLHLFFNQNEDIGDWKVDTNNPNKVFAVKTENLDGESIKAIVQKAGYKAEKVS